jgi:hypothetical protein
MSATLEGVWVAAYSTLVTLLLLSWAYIFV